MHLKPQDNLIGLKYWSLHKAGDKYSVRKMAESIGVSSSEVSKGAKRLINSKLAVERRGAFFIETAAFLEWLCHGIRFAYPQESIGYGRGMLTSWNCPLIESEMVPPDPAIVWPVPGGETDGVLIKPIHKSIPFAASRDERLYTAFSLLEAIRGGKPRELEIARRQLTRLLRGNDGK